MRLLVDDTRCVGIRRADGGLVHSIIINTFFTNFVFVHFLCKSFSCAQIQIFVTRKIPKIFVNNLVCETLIVVSNHNDIQLPIFRTLIKGISSGIFPASQQLGHEIRVLHAYFTTLSTNMEYDNEDEFDPVPMYYLSLKMLQQNFKFKVVGHSFKNCFRTYSIQFNFGFDTEFPPIF